MVPAAADSPHISLHAIAGIRTSEMMQVRLELGGASLLALLDSGLTNNFVSEDAAARTSLQHLSQGNMKVMVANSERVLCSGLYCATTFSIAGKIFTTHFFSHSHCPAKTSSSAHSGWPR